MDISFIQPEDYKYFVERPDSTFSPRRNKAIIQETIRETEIFFNNIGKAVNDNLGERIEILSSYATYRFNRGDKRLDQYLDKRTMTKLIGERILEKVRVMETVNKLNGNTKYKNFIEL